MTGGSNAFVGDQRFGPVRCSDVFRWFLAGWLHHPPEMMVFYAPTVNSYKRYQAGFVGARPASPGATTTGRPAFAWSGSGTACGSSAAPRARTVNPYLAYAAALHSGLDGIANHMEPPPVFEGDVYQADHLPHVPRTLHEALGRFEQSDFARRVFGAEVVEHYAHFFHVEQAAFDQAVTDWERKRYFERI